jgi:hypothetical protein
VPEIDHAALVVVSEEVHVRDLHVRGAHRQSGRRSGPQRPLVGAVWVRVRGLAEGQLGPDLDRALEAAGDGTEAHVEVVHPLHLVAPIASTS